MQCRGVAKNWGWAGGSILSEFGSLQLEFQHLSDVTGDPAFAAAVRHNGLNHIASSPLSQAARCMDYVVAHVPKDGLYSNYISPASGTWGARACL